MLGEGEGRGQTRRLHDEPVQLIVMQVLPCLLFQKVGAARILQQRQVPEVRAVRHDLRDDAVQVGQLNSPPNDVLSDAN